MSDLISHSDRSQARLDEGRGGAGGMSLLTEILKQGLHKAGAVAIETAVHVDI